VRKPTEVIARTQVATLYRDLGGRGMNAGSTGNVSLLRASAMIITASGSDAEDVTPDDLAVISLTGRVQGPATPSSEWHLHAAIYKVFPAARCVIHTHSDAATALACLNESLPPFHYMIAGFGGNDVRCAPYVTFGTPELAALAVVAMRGRNACLLANHGMVVFGRDTKHALTQAVLLETLCRQYLMARAAGTVRLLTPEEMRAARVRFKTYGPLKKTTLKPSGGKAKRIPPLRATAIKPQPKTPPPAHKKNQAPRPPRDG